MKNETEMGGGCRANRPCSAARGIQKIKKQIHTHFLAGLGKTITKLSASQIEFRLTLCGDVAVEHWYAKGGVRVCARSRGARVCVSVGVRACLGWAGGVCMYVYVSVCLGAGGW